MVELHLVFFHGPFVSTITRPFPDLCLVRPETDCSSHWLALGSFLNSLRVREYGMRPLTWMWATDDFPKAKIPIICLWSSHILPRPLEWDREVIIGGYTSLDHGTHYTPPDSLKAFLDTQRPVLVISFGSNTIPDPAKLLSTLSSAVGRIQASAVVCRSWSAKMEIDIDIPPHLYLVDTIPHGWLLPRADGFVHHGGAGHTAAGLRAGVPMLLIPFLLDQYFWAAKVCELGFGPPPLKIRTLTAHELAASLRRLLLDGYRDRCTKVAKQIQAEGDGADVAADVILRELALPEMKLSCSLIPALRADWQHMESRTPLLGAAAACLVSCEIISWEDLNLQSCINWTERLRAVHMSLGWAHKLSTVTKFITLVLDILNAIVLWFVGVKADIGAAGQEHNAATMRDPVRVARIRQGQFDLELIQQHVDEKQAAAFSDQLVKYWQSLVAAKFREHCLNHKSDDVKCS